jgi:tetratricopeptide (TPR) repeat protein
LVLQARDVAGPARWRWLLTDAEGRFVADHEVALDESADLYEAFVDLYGFVRRNRTPDDPVGSETALVAELGGWVGERVFGAVGAALSGTVRVQVPAEASFLPARPLELAHVDGQPLARRGVSMVYQLVGAHSTDRKERVGDRLRVLALFSLPSTGSVLALRRERYELVRKVRQIAGTGRLAIELRVLQYGVTRQRLADAVQEYPGWDVLHVSGHGEAGTVLLEREDGSPDPVTTSELVALLTPAADRLKLAVLLACQSGADLAADTLRALELPEAAEQLELAQPEPAAGPSGGPGLARGLVDQLGVAVLAMRYPVVDSYAVALSGELYPLLLQGGQPVDRAVALAVPAAAGTRPSMSRPAMSIATAALFGPAAGLRLNPPVAQTTLDVYAERLAGFPPEPERFVGRTRALVAASAALAPDSGRAGVWFVGMAGAGKTACALELAHQHRNRFRPAWWQAPTQPDEQAQALPSLANAVEAQLGVPMMQAVGSESALRAFLPHLRALLREEPILLVLDNLETLLTSTRTWRDPLWTVLLDTLLAHGGLSRVVATSRQAPAGLDTSRMLSLATHALSLAESVLLARELPNLARLLHDEPQPERSTSQVQQDRRLARQVLAVVQGHPKLLELADATAADPHHLAQALTAAGAAGRDAPVQAFFATGTSDLDGTQFLAILQAWTLTALAELPAPARAMAELIAVVEDDDRTTGLIESVWSRVWEQLWAPSHGSAVPPAEEMLAVLRVAALVEAVPPEPQLSTVDSDSVVPDDEGLVELRMHPGIAEAIRIDIDPARHTRVDGLLAGLWVAEYMQAMTAELQGHQASRRIVHAGLAAAPYLLRTEKWDQARRLLDQVRQRDSSPALTLQVLGHLRQILDSDPDPDQRPVHEGVYASVLAKIDPPAAQDRLRQAINAARTRDQHALASSLAGVLADLLRRRGNHAGALKILDENVEPTRLAGLGPWTQAGDEVQRLKILASTGQHRQALDRAEALLQHLDTLPAQPDQATEQTWAYYVRETTLSVAEKTAFELGDWQRSLDLNRQIQHSQHRRGATAHDQARTRFNSYGALLGLDRFNEAHDLLLDCQQVFEDAGDFGRLGYVFGARADLEDRRGHPERALDLQQTALRYHYQSQSLEPDRLAIGHRNLAIYLIATGDHGRANAHWLAAALLYAVSGNTTSYVELVNALSTILLTLGEPALPAGLTELVATVQAVPGVRFGDVAAELVPEPAAQKQLFADTIAAARNHDPTAELLQQWKPIIAAVVAAAHGDAQGAEHLTSDLDRLSTADDWAKLVDVIRHIIGGNRDEAELLDGLDPIETAITRAILDQLAPTAD